MYASNSNCFHRVLVKEESSHQSKLFNAVFHRLPCLDQWMVAACRSSDRSTARPMTREDIEHAASYDAPHCHNNRTKNSCCAIVFIVRWTVYTSPGAKTIKKSGAWIGAQLTILCSKNRKLRSGDYKEIGVRFLCLVRVSYSNKSKQISDSMNRGL